VASLTFHPLRRRLALAGGHAAAAAADAAGGRRETASYRPAALVEGPLRAIPVGAPQAWTDPIAFLDGTQHVELLGYLGTDPVLGADVRAAVRVRRARRLVLGTEAHERLVVARPRALALLADSLPDDVRSMALDDDEPPHPIADAERAHAMVDRARTALEIDVARRFRAVEPTTWCLVDGSLATSPDWARDARMLGVVKSHATLPFTDDALHTYLTLPAGHRTSVFAPATRQVAPVYAWALRLHAWQGKDLFHGLLRIEAPATAHTLAHADAWSRHLLAERAPLAADRRADRLLYGIHDVERYLRARAGGG
jgi:hypothetical protein